MNRSTQSILTNLLLGAVLLVGVLQVWQLNRIEARLLAAPPTTRPSGPDAVTPVTTGSCRDQAWWKSDEAATAEDGNLLKMHARCLIEDPVVVRGGTLRRIWGQDPNGLNVYGDGGNSADVQELYRYVGNWLAYRQADDTDVFSPELAQTVLRSEDGLTFTITLRKGVKWHTPQVDMTDPRHAWLAGDHELVADDYVFVIENLLDKDVAGRFAPLRSALPELVSVREVDRYTFEVKVSERRHGTLDNLLRLGPLPRWLYAFDEDGKPFDKASFPEKFLAHWYNQKAIGTGPYLFGDWVQGQRITMTKNPAYWGDPPTFDKVDLIQIQDKAGWPRALQNKELDFVHLLPAQYRTSVLEAPDGRIFGDSHVKSGLNETFAFFFVGWNRTNPLFQDKRVRRALTMGIDRQALLDNVYYGLGQVISGPLPPASTCYDKSIRPWPYDPAQAATLLAEAGWKDTDGDGILDRTVDGRKQTFSFSLMLFGSSEEWRTIGNQFAEAYRKLGIQVNLDPEEWATQQQRMKKREFDAVTGSWTLDYEYDPRGLWHSSTADIPDSINYISFREPELDKLIESFETDFDEAHRLETCHAMHAFQHDDEPYTLLFSRTTPVLWWDWMNPLRFFPANPYRDLRYYSFAVSRP